MQANMIKDEKLQQRSLFPLKQTLNLSPVQAQRPVGGADMPVTHLGISSPHFLVTDLSLLLLELEKSSSLLERRFLLMSMA